MLSFLKKTSDKSSAAAVPAWHPNFRNFERLPDTKVVRTTFFINGMAILITVSLLIYASYRQLELSTLKSDTEAARKIVEANKSGSDQAIALFKKFQEQEKKIQDLQQFLSVSQLTVSEFLLQLGSSLPPLVNINSVDYRAAGVTLRGGIKGSAEEGAGFAVSYVEALKSNTYFSNLFGSITLTNIVRDAGSGEIRFEIDLKFKAPAKPAAGGKK